jgi:hypothetical protein
MNAGLRSGQIPGKISKMIVILLVLTTFMAFHPQPAQASCAFKYTVQSGDSLYGIANRFSVKFDDLVTANKLTTPYLIYVGQVLCMPPGAIKPVTTPIPGTTPAASAKKVPVIAGVYLGNITWVGVSNFPRERIYYVNAYPAEKQYWSKPEAKLGMISTDKNGQFGAWFHVPPEIGYPYTITVCVKDVITDDVVACAGISNWDYWLERNEAKTSS